MSATAAAKKKQGKTIAEGAKTTTVSDQLNREVEKRNKIGPTVRVRAIERGFYGYPLADIREEGAVFRMAIKDLTPATGDAKNYKGKPQATIEHEGTMYDLPTWVVDAATPIENDEDDDQDDDSTDSNIDVLG